MGTEMDDQKQIQLLERVIEAYEKIIKLNEQEIANSDEIIEMYETISETYRKELMEARQTANARDVVSTMASDELKLSLDRIKQLEQANKDLRKQAEELKPD